MEERKWKVYKYSLKNDTRVYIGQTHYSLNRRSGNNGERYKGCTKFYNAIQKYGWNSFSVEIIKDNLTLYEANKLETEMIIKFNSIEEGFNLSYGGNSMIPSEETRQRMSESKQGEKNNRFGVKLSDETKRKIGEGNKKAQLGKVHSQETKEKMRKSHTKNSKRVECVETGEIFESPTEAAFHKTGKRNGSHIGEVCKGRRKSAYGFKWRYIK